jgi:kelch-like protein 2/3
VTVVSEDGLKGSLHKFILANASSYFLNIFQNFHESKHPTVILSGIRSDILQLLVNYIYTGSVDVPKAKLDLLISAGRSLKIKVTFNLHKTIY